ncbi:prostaglandin E synthase 2 [Anastrepha ludens]|uniref:prostaglandin E synthase 2 n=1 Tax=Anastrepha ludens TaxID=28586 RepID=UPI0023B1E8DD|nr:prostaglandin E synthase 2 [Anastrepha ludens]
MSTLRISRRLVTCSGSRPIFGNVLPVYRAIGQQYRHYASQLTPKPTSTFKLALIGAGIGAASGTAYSIYGNWKDKGSHMEHQRIPPKILRDLPDIRITKKYVNPRDDSNLKIILFQYQACPFCCKVRAFLDYMGISYSVVEVDAVLRQDIKWSEQKKVPMVLVQQDDGRYIQLTDSSAIISLLASYLNDKQTDIGYLASFYPTITFFDDDGKKRLDILNKYFLMYQDKTPKHVTQDMQENERKWRTWADSHLVHLISPNCYRTLGEARETFEWFSKAGEWDIYFPSWERNLMVNVGAIAMWGISKMLKRRHGLSDDVRTHIYDALDKWTKELEKRKQKFMGGDRPNLADLSVFGVLNSMEGCEAFGDCMANTKIGVWYNNLKELVDHNRGNLIRRKDLVPLPA